MYLWWSRWAHAWVSRALADAYCWIKTQNQLWPHGGRTTTVMGHHSEPVIYEADIVITVASLTYRPCSTLLLGGTKKYTFFLKYNVVLQWMRLFHLCTTLNISAKQSVVLCNFVKKWKKITVGKKLYALKIPSSTQCTEYVCLGAAWLLFHKGLRTCK